MALTGLQIFKYLPGGKKEKEANCKKCGFPTCMAYAMKLAKKEVPADKCEFISDELKKMLDEAGQIQQAEIVFGSKTSKIKVGNEIVMFRHDKKFVNPTCIAVKLDSADPDFDVKLKDIADYSLERVGEVFKISAVALFDSDNDRDNYLDKATMISNLDIPLILISTSYENIRNILEKLPDIKPAVCLQDEDAAKSACIEKEYKVPVIIQSDSIEELSDKVTGLLENGTENLILNLETSQNGGMIEKLTYLRRAAIEDKYKPLGFPVLSFIQSRGNIYEEAIIAAALICKYSNMIVLDNFNKALFSALYTLRQNIFTDPQKPLQIESKIYPVGEVDANSPVFVTTNFALTYFSVVNEIESSGIPAYVSVTPSDGMSVLTAWAASKFTGEIIAKSVIRNNLSSLVNHKNLIIPGYVSSLRDEIIEELPDWEVIAGPNEAFDIANFLKAS